MRSKPSGFKEITGFIAAAALTLGLGLGLAAETSVTADGSTPHTVTVADNQGPTVVTP
ncbi:hypothetical protein ACIO93_25870 [Streptomyces sp. NPDC087903]|uniref:hypothetical protein n=1 Tax=unclassified Streptomyces TaxID=2593676 RepID=UPI0032556BF9